MTLCRHTYVCMGNKATEKRLTEITGHAGNPFRAINSGLWKAKAQRKESAVQAYVSHCKQGLTQGPTLLKWHYKWQTANYNPMASGWLIQSQQKECSLASFCRHAMHTTLSFSCCSFGQQITTKLTHMYDFSSLMTAPCICFCTKY